jgi:serine/threonine protein phosphatase PrpC
MQGWRKSMEDAHIAVTDIPLPMEGDNPESSSDAKVFGVFDGHGGAEVARFVGLYLVSVLTQQPSWKEGMAITPPSEGDDAGESKIGRALRRSFHALDRMINDHARRYVSINSFVCFFVLRPCFWLRRFLGCSHNMLFSRWFLHSF